MHCGSVRDVVCLIQRVGEANKQPAHSIVGAASASSVIPDQIGYSSCAARQQLVSKANKGFPDLAHDLSKAHGLIDAGNGPRQVCQKRALIVSGCQPGVLRIGVYLLQACQSISRAAHSP